MSFIEKIQAQSPAVKGQIAFWTAGIIAGGIGVVWLTTLPSHFAAVGQGEQEARVASLESASEDGGFGAIFTAFGAQVGALIESVQTPPEAISGTPEETGVEQGGATSSSTATSSDASLDMRGTSTATTTESERRPVLIGTSTRAKTE